MQIVNNTILDSTPAKVGDWRNISNFVALSVHLTGLEGAVTVEVSNDPDAATGIAITPDLTLGNPLLALTDEIAIFYDGAGGAMVNPSCLAWNFIRVKKVGGGSVETKAFLFGQNG